MENKEEQSENHSREHIFILGSFFVVLIAWITLILTELRIFYKSIILIFMVLLLISFFIIYIKKRKTQKIKIRLSKIDYFVIVFVLLFAVFNCFFAHETFFGGRDYGVYSNSAVYLAKHHNLIIEENMSNLHFAGYSNLIGNFFQPDFHFAYISWLASHYSFLGVTGLKWANFLLMIIGLLSLYFMGEKLSNKKAGLIAMLLFAASFPMFWFTRRTLTEIFSFSLLWFGILCFVEFYKTKNKFYIIPTILSFGLLLHTRLEVIFIFFFFLAVLFLLHFKKKIILNKWAFLLILIVIAHLILYTIFIQPTYIEVVRSEWSEWTMNKELYGIETLPQTVDFSYLAGYHVSLYVFKVLSAYNLYFFILLIPIAILYLFKKKKLKLDKLIPFLIILPIFIFLYNPRISWDNPWFLRRFVPNLLPCGFLYTGIFFSAFKKRLVLIITLITLIINLTISAPILFFRENEGLFDQTKEISALFSKNDKIFVDVYALNSSFSVIADPLFFIFDKKTECISEWMASSGQLNNSWINADLSTFDNIYLISNSQSDWFFKYGYIPKNKTEIISIQNISYPHLKFKHVTHLSDIREPIEKPKIAQINNSITIYKLRIS